MIPQPVCAGHRARLPGTGHRRPVSGKRLRVRKQQDLSIVQICAAGYLFLPVSGFPEEFSAVSLVTSRL